MSLKNDFYTVKETASPLENSVKGLIELNAAHIIYKGHFPEMPVVPGVLQIQIIKELLEDHLNKKINASVADNIFSVK